MRRVWLVPLLVTLALVLQLTVIDGLHLPRGGVPDVVLVLVAALAMAYGPLPGMIIGFVTGVCVDIAPPGSPFIGQYALVFFLAGWAAGSLGRFTKRSPLRALAVAAAVIVGAEAIAAALGKLLEPDQVSVAEIRQFLPITIAYDLVICPFVLYLVILAATTKAHRGVADSALAGTGLLSVQARAKRASQKPRPHQPRLDPAAARAGDAWVGGGPRRHPGSVRPTQRARLHPGAGVAGSASGYAPPPTRLPARPVKLRLSTAQRGRADMGSIVGGSRGQQLHARRHVGALAGGHQIRFGGELGGSAAGKPAPAGPVPKRLRINFRSTVGGAAGRQQGPAGPRPSRLRINFRGTLGGSAERQHGPAGPGPRPVRINFSANGGGKFGTNKGMSGLTTGNRARTAAPRLRIGTSRSALATTARTATTRSVPTLHFHTSPAPIARRQAAVPKFRRRSSLLHSSSLTTAVVAGGVLDQRTLRARRKAAAPSRLRLSRRKGGLGMLGGSGRSTLHRPAPRARKQPRFGYGRRSPLTFMMKRRLGSGWLTRLRAGRRSGPWLIGKRTGGPR